jgi:hypothetical protein
MNSSPSCHAPPCNPACPPRRAGQHSGRSGRLRGARMGGRVLPPCTSTGTPAGRWAVPARCRTLPRIRCAAGSLRCWPWLPSRSARGCAWPSPAGDRGARAARCRSRTWRRASCVHRRYWSRASVMRSCSPARISNTCCKWWNLVEAAGELDGFPPIRAAVTYGEAHERSGDWCGDSVNLASRITKAADPGTVVVSQAVRDRARPAFAGRRSRPAS